MKQISRQQIREAVAVLREGGVVVFPTETSYGLAADATNASAVRWVFRLKGRAASKSPPLIASDLAMVEKYAVLSPGMKRLAKAHWPGALTVVTPIRSLPLFKGESEGVTRSRRVTSPGPSLKRRGTLVPQVIRNGEIALRVSSHPVARALSRGLGVPIVATSANVSGAPACYSVGAFRKQIGPTGPIGPICFLDAGALPRRKLSTIVREEKGEIIVLRRGGVTPPVRRGK